MPDSSVLIYSDNSDLSLQLLSKGKELAQKIRGKLFALLIGFNVKDSNLFLERGADKVYVSDAPELQQFYVETYCKVLIEAIKRARPEIILVGATKRGKELAARLAAALDTGCITECLGLQLDEGKLVAERLAYGGSVISTEVSRRRPHILTIPPRIFEKPEQKSRTGEIEKIEFKPSSSKVHVVERRKKVRGDEGLVDAPIIVSAGRGFKKEEDLKLLNDLAGILGAKIGCTRPIAADMGWLEEWVGISGVKVKPKLYVACGISGIVQHAAGMRESRIIVSINKQETANIFELSDYSIAGDLYKVVPALTKALKNRIK